MKQIKLFLFATVLLIAMPLVVNAQQRTQQQNTITITVKGVSFKMVRVQGGTFTMGAKFPNELSDKDKFQIEHAMFGDNMEYSLECFDLDEPPHSVTLSDYYIGETEVTQELWQAVMGTNPSSTAPQKTNKSQCNYDSFVADAKLLNAKKPGTVRIPTRAEWDAAMVTMTASLKHPVESVNWEDCQEFIRKLNQLTGRNFRLPTEAEWEYAARGGNKSRGYKYAGSNDPDAVAWYERESKSLTIEKHHPVKAKQANELGIYDMSGNVREWCQDWYDRYSSDSQTNPQGPSAAPTNLKIPMQKRKTDNYWFYYDFNSCHVIRGGSFDHDSNGCRVWNREKRKPNHIDGVTGLRLAL